MQGGLFGGDLTMKVDGDEVAVVENGTTQRHGHIERRRAEGLAAMAARVARMPVDQIHVAPDVVHGANTAIAIGGSGFRAHLNFPAGSKTPEEVLDLIEAVEEACEPESIRAGEPCNDR